MFFYTWSSGIELWDAELRRLMDVAEMSDSSEHKRISKELADKLLSSAFLTVGENLARDLRLSSSLRQFKRIKEALNGVDAKPYPLRPAALRVMLTELGTRVSEELEDRLFLFVLPENAALYRLPLEGWGETRKKFPSASYDVEEAGRCIALERSTAAVFHLMRALEFGLVALGKTLGIAEEQLSGQNWDRIIVAIEAAIRKVQLGERHEQKSADTHFYSLAATQFAFFKDAWRNYVSHAGVSYNTEQAVGIHRSVRDFMRQIATRLTE